MVKDLNRYNIQKAKCIICGTWFYRKKRPGGAPARFMARIGLGKYTLRPSNNKVCSKKCAMYKRYNTPKYNGKEVEVSEL